MLEAAGMIPFEYTEEDLVRLATRYAILRNTQNANTRIWRLNLFMIRRFGQDRTTTAILRALETYNLLNGNR